DDPQNSANARPEAVQPGINIHCDIHRIKQSSQIAVKCYEPANRQASDKYLVPAVTYNSNCAQRYQAHVAPREQHLNCSPVIRRVAFFDCSAQKAVSLRALLVEKLNLDYRADMLLKKFRFLACCPLSRI